MRNDFTFDSSSSVHLNPKPDRAHVAKPHRKRRTDRFDISPSEMVIRNILNYSLALSILPTKDPVLKTMLVN